MNIPPIHKHSNPKEPTVINLTAPPIFGDIGSSPAMPTFLASLHTIGKYPRRHLHTLSHSKLRAADFIYPAWLSRWDISKVVVWKLVVSVGWCSSVTSSIAPGFIPTQNCAVLQTGFGKNRPRRVWHPKAQPLRINKHAISQKAPSCLVQTRRKGVSALFSVIVHWYNLLRYTLVFFFPRHLAKLELLIH